MTRLAADPILGELRRSQLAAAVADMGQVLSRNAVSEEIVQQRDFANAIVLDNGEVAVLDNHLHLGPVQETAAAMQDLFQFAMKPGDVILSNDPYSGGSHVQDFTLLSPIYSGRQQVCHLVCRAHLPDIGGQIAGGYFPFADDVWAEGSRIPPLKIVQEGKIVGDKLDAVLINSRYPRTFFVDLQAMLAALEIGRRRLEEMIIKHGEQALSLGLQHCLQMTESQIRAEIASWPRGTVQASAFLDHDARGRTDLEIRVELTIGENLRLDFAASAPQSGGFVNSTRANTISHALVPFYALMGESMPANSALLRAIQIVTTPGTVVHPLFPAPVGWGPSHVAAEIVAAVAMALGQLFPERQAALAPRWLMLVGSWPQRANRFPLHTFLQGGAAAACGADGWGLPGPFSRGIMPSIEMVEGQLPLQVRRLEFLPDSAGEGEWRGGLGTIAEFEFREPTLLAAILEGRKHTCPGMAGGASGKPNSVEIDGSGPIEDVRWEHDVTGRLVTACVGGGGGWGDPAERDPAARSADIANQVVSSNGATAAALRAAQENTP